MSKIRHRRSAVRRARWAVAAASIAMATPVAMADGVRSSGAPSRDPGPAYAQAYGKPFLFYVGGAIGQNWVDVDYRHAALGDWIANEPATTQIINGLGTGSFSGSNTTVTGLMGLDYRAGGLLFGVEFDMNYIGFQRRRETATGAPVGAFGGIGNIDAYTSARIAHLETLRLRLGYTFHTTTLFMTGGLAFGEVELAQSLALPGGENAAYPEARKLMHGWALGGGFERQLNRDVALRAEYLYADLGSYTRHYASTIAPTATHRTDYDVTAHIARIGLKVSMHEFGGGDAGGPSKAGAVAGTYVDYAAMTSDFSGLYISPIFGTLSGNTKFALGRFNAGNFDDGPGPYFRPGTASAFGGVHTVKLEGFTFGGVLGYQKQFGNMLLGADVGLHSGAAVDGRKNCTPSDVDHGVWSSDFTALCQSRLVYHTAFRLRAGIVNDKWLLYVNGGPAFAKIDNAVSYKGTLQSPDGPLAASYFDEKGSVFTKGWTAGVGIEYEWKPGMVLGLSYNHTQLEDVVADLRRADGTVNTRRTIATDPDVIGSSLKIRLGDTAPGVVQPPPAPAAQQVAAATAPPPPAAAPAPAPRPTAAPRPQRPRPAAARPSAQPATARPAQRPAPTSQAVPRPAKPVDGTPMEPAPQMGQPRK